MFDPGMSQEQRLGERLMAYLCGELAGEDREALEAELLSNAATRARLEELRDTMRFMERLFMEAESAAPLSRALPAHISELGPEAFEEPVASLSPGPMRPWFLLLGAGWIALFALGLAALAPRLMSAPRALTDVEEVRPLPAASAPELATPQRQLALLRVELALVYPGLQLDLKPPPRAR